jgi:glycosyltransferase involved in cell wall biosynthesis
LPEIAIDYTPAYEQGGGIGRYVRELVAALLLQDVETSYRLFVAGASLAQLPAQVAPNFDWRPTRITPKWFARIWQRANLPLYVETFTGPVNLYHATDFVLPPTRPKTRTLLTVHDLSFVRVPEAASPNLKAYLDVVVPRSVNRADCVLADSQATKNDLIELYNVSPEKIIVLLSGVDARFKPVSGVALGKVREKYGLGDAPYVLSVGTVQPRKNYVRLIQAVSQLRGQGHDLHLVIAGGRGWLEDPIYAAVASEKMQPYVHLIGFADESDLPALYSAAACFAFPSLYEGFGLPILEAMGCGTPVVTSDKSSLPEVAGDAALIVDPYKVDDLAHAIRDMINNDTLRQMLIDKGYQRAEAFTWEKSARHLQQIYTDLL